MNLTTKLPITPWTVLTLGTLTILLFELVGVVAGNFWGFLYTFLFAMLLAFVAGGLTYKYIGDYAGAPVAIGFLLVTIISGMNAARPIWLSFTSETPVITEPISVARAPEYEASTYTFNDAKILPYYAGYYFSKGTVSNRTGGRSYVAHSEYYVAPLVSPTWTKEEPVTAWGVCTDTWRADNEFSNTDTCRAVWKKTNTQGIELEPSKFAEIELAITDAKEKYGLTSHENAKYLVWSNQAVSEGDSAKEMAYVLMILSHLSYAGYIVVKRKSIK